MSAFVLSGCGKDPRLDKAEAMAWEMIHSRFLKSDGDTYTTLAKWESLMNEYVEIIQFKNLTLEVTELKLKDEDEMNGISYKAQCRLVFDGVRTMNPYKPEWSDWSAPSHDVKAYIWVYEKEGELAVSMTMLKKGFINIDIEDCQKDPELQKFLNQYAK